MFNKFIIIILIIIYFVKNSTLDTSENSCLSQYLRSCDSGECTDSSKFCDGKIDCEDESDETEINCKTFVCPINTFKCNYGGCIPNSHICDGKSDCIDGSDEEKCFLSDHLNVTIRDKRQSGCESELQTRCKNGECIPRIEFCDGIAHCSDGSDETYETCHNKIPCRIGFQCKYGACISKRKTCDGKKDCVDNSDESSELCQAEVALSPVTPLPPVLLPTPSPKTRCIVPNIKNLAMYRNKYDSYYINRLSPGDTVESSIKPLYYACENRYLLREHDNLPDYYINYCIDDVWTKGHPSCTKLCSSADLSGISFSASCNGKKNDCRLKNYQLPGTIAKLSCAYNYKEPDFYRNSLLCEEDGNWNYIPQRCEQKCGILSDLLVPYISGGNATEIFHVPWHAAIFYQKSKYDDYKNICGGTIINPSLILSAAHCFWNKTRTYNEKLMDHTKFSIVVGTKARNFADRSPHSQTFSVIKIIPHENFEGQEQSYFYDIAIVVLNSTISYNDFALPICINKNLHSKIQTGVKGKIAGWGEIKNGQHPNTLQSIEIMSLSYLDCKSKVKQYLTSDKFCLDTKNSTGSHVCYGDSGGGFVQLIKDMRNDERYILRGILSTGYQTVICGNNVVAGFTDIYTHDYVKFIDDTENLYNPK